MKIIKDEITIEQLASGYVDRGDDGVVGFDGKLDIRPAYQREFVYKEGQRNLVIDTVIKGFPLNTMYWNTKDDGSFEVLDGQQRTISICQYITDVFSFNKKIFSRQPSDIQKQILGYKLDVYKCTGNESERLNWFQVINIAGAVLKKQEIRNAIYTGPWTESARKKFSKQNCRAYVIGRHYMPGTVEQQDYLERVLKWVSNDNIEEYMNQHCKDSNADELWDFFDRVIGWIKDVFGDSTGKELKLQSVEWGYLYNEHSDKKLDKEKIRTSVKRLLMDDEVTNKPGIYQYVLDGNEKHLNIRAFKDNDRIAMYEKQGGKCNMCGAVFELEKMHADHIKPWSSGGKTELKNGQMLCRECNLKKSNI